MPGGDNDHLAIVLHELRNPLVGIDGAARVLERELGSHPAARRASAIASEARQLLALLESVADAEAASAGRLRCRPSPLDLAALVRETLAGLHLDGHRVDLTGADAPLRVHADAARIRQVLVNLVLNAAQYSPSGTPIDVVVKRQGRSVRVEVRDQGPGIPASERKKLFRKFTRLSTADGTRGSGLGLYVCKAIVEDHGGTIAYHQNSFSFTLPLASSRASRRAVRPRDPARVGDHPTVGRRSPERAQDARIPPSARREGGGPTRVKRVSVGRRGATRARGAARKARTRQDMKP